MITKIQQELKQLADPTIADQSHRFFKIGHGDYGEGDVFLGIRVPVLRKLAKTYAGISLADAGDLLRSSYHEQRLLALILMVNRFKIGGPEEKKAIFDLYVSSTAYINNWDLVDISAHHIAGQYLAERKKGVLYQFARSSDLWERRIAVIATFHFIKNGSFEDTLAISEILLHDKEDLIHKAVGWMLREVGKRDMDVEERFLSRHYRTMPRTMLRYAIEKFTEKKRQAYLRGTVDPTSAL